MSSIAIRLGHRAIQETSCSSCVKTAGCLYCPDSYLTSDSSGTCVCGETYHYNTHSYGPATCGINQEQFNSPLDCQFGVDNGEVIVAVICIFVVLALVMICWCIASRGTCSDDICVSPSTPPVAFKPKQQQQQRPAYTLEETAPRPMVIPDRTDSLRVCSIMATDVVLVASAPLEEPITVIPAESEIIVSPPYVV
jgi:hypothetical protein